MLRDRETAAFAFSGGVDSVFLLAAAARAGMERILAVTLVSAFFTLEERRRAGRIAGELGVDHLCLDLDVLTEPGIAENDARRCYYCKQAGFSAIKAAAADRGIKTLVHGINLDDLKDYRPGIQAARELGFEAPLVEAGFSKGEIRDCSRDLGLDTWDLPSQSCLATRIPQGDLLTAEALGMVEAAERFLHGLGFAQVRVRNHGGLARIEVAGADMDRMASPQIREQVADALKKIGFTFVSLDMEGYASGKMNPTKTT